MARSVGIDLGTTYSVLAYVNEKQIPMICPVGDGSPVMPSVVFFGDDEVAIGQSALRQSKAGADRLVQYIKEKIGQRWRSAYQGIEHTPETISAIILGELLRRSAPKTGPIESAVITVPACFTERQRKSTQQAGELAKLRVLGTLNEPMAAALMFAHQFQKDASKDPSLVTDKPQYIAVYDLGGGTFDVTIIRVTPNAMQELITNGDRQLGGKDWDQCLFDHVAAEWRRTLGVNVVDDPQGRQDLILACEQTKRLLTEKTHARLGISVSGSECTIEVSRETFEEISAHLVESTRLTLERTMQEAGLTWNTLDRVVLVGGSTFLPSIRNMLHQAHGRKPDTRVHPMVAVAQGAALYAHMLETGAAHREFIQLTGRDQSVEDSVFSPDSSRPGASDKVSHAVTQMGAAMPKSNTSLNSSATIAESLPVLHAAVVPGRKEVPLPPDIVATSSVNRSSQTETAPRPLPSSPQVTFVTSSGFGVAVMHGREARNTVLIPRNTSVPVTRTKIYYTVAVLDAHSVIPINVTQGDSEKITLVEPLGTVLIDGLPEGAPSGQEVHVTFQLDVQGRLQVQAVYANTGRKVRATLEIAGCLRQDEVKEYRAALVEKRLVEE